MWHLFCYYYITFKCYLHFLFFLIQNNTIYQKKGKVYFRLPSNKNKNYKPRFLVFLNPLSPYFNIRGYLRISFSIALSTFFVSFHNSLALYSVSCDCSMIALLDFFIKDQAFLSRIFEFLFLSYFNNFNYIFYISPRISFFLTKKYKNPNNRINSGF